MKFFRSVIVTHLIIAAIALISFACSKGAAVAAVDPLSALNLPATPYAYANPGVPAYFANPVIVGQDNTPADNPISDAGATLGRVLFYDKKLSINNSISCGSCHHQQFGFSDTAKLSKGFAGGSTGRHSMSLVNARYYPSRRFFWDERAATLELQVLTPVQDHVEMGMNLDTLVNRLTATTHYPVLFKNAFGDAAVESAKVSRALSQFVRSIVSYRSKFDIGRTQVPPGMDPVQTPYANFTVAENQGKQIFFNPVNACASCHGTETFTAPADRNNGLENPAVDRGVGAITNNLGMVGNFKAPSLKSIALTAPYMHDGRFTSLEQVVEHYNAGIVGGPNLSPQLRNPDGSPKRLNLSAEQKSALVAFLRTLTDDGITADVKFGNPFR